MAIAVSGAVTSKALSSKARGRKPEGCWRASLGRKHAETAVQLAVTVLIVISHDRVAPGRQVAEAERHFAGRGGCLATSTAFSSLRNVAGSR